MVNVLSFVRTDEKKRFRKRGGSYIVQPMPYKRFVWTGKKPFEFATCGRVFFENGEKTRYQKYPEPCGQASSLRFKGKTTILPALAYLL